MLKEDAKKMTEKQIKELNERNKAQNSVYENPLEVRVIEVDSDGLVIKIDPIKLDKKGITALCKVLDVKEEKTQKETVAAIKTKVKGG